MRTVTQRGSDETGDGFRGRRSINALLETDIASYDLVVLDLMLPGVSGIEVLKQIRATQPELPVIVYTNGFVPLLVDKALAAGATEVYNEISLTSYELTQAFAKYLRRKAA